MGLQQLTKTGIIFLTTPLTANKNRAAGDNRFLEKGYITFVTLGAQALTLEPMQVWGEVHLARTEGLTEFSCATICQGYLSASHIPSWTGRLPVFPGDYIWLGGLADIVMTLYASIRFEEA